MPNYRCQTCHESRYEVLPATPGCEYVCNFHRCDGEMERISVCRRCKDNDAMQDGDYCVSCCSDDVVADPRELDSYTEHDARLIVRELAARLRVVRLDKRQAA